MLNLLLVQTQSGGGTFPAGQGVKDITELISVPGGQYAITFDANSGDFSFTQLGNSIVAPKVFALTVDGATTEADWVIEKPVGKVVDGTAPETPAEIFFGAAYNDELLYVAVNITDATPTDEVLHVFVDGNKNGGAYDASDVHFTVDATGAVTLVTPATGVTVEGAAVATATGLSIEASIAWADLGVTAVEGEGIKIDVIVEADGGDYFVAWNGGLQNLTSLGSLGDLTLGGLSCGNISLYSQATGDIVLRNPTDAPTTYVGTYKLGAAASLKFRKDKANIVTWGDAAFPEGTATLDGAAIAATTGKYRITFDCLSGDYTFAAVADETALAAYTATAPVIDGDISDYALDYASDLVVVGTAANNNTVTWGAKWDANNIYIAAQVVDAVVEGAGNPWDNDAIEMYIDGNHDEDGAYDGAFDTQLIMDFASNQNEEGVDQLWVKADGYPATDFSSKWLATSNGYAIEVRLNTAEFGFSPASGRSIGFSIGNNDSDGGVGRDYQTAWVGTGDNWNNTAILGDLEMTGGFITKVNTTSVANSVNLFPNPTTGDVTVRFNDAFTGTITVTNIAGQVVKVQTANGITEGIIELSNLSAGMYMVKVEGNGSTNMIKVIKQ